MSRAARASLPNGAAFQKTAMGEDLVLVPLNGEV